MALKDIVKQMAGIVDIILAPFIVIFSPIAFTIAQLGPRARISRGILDRWRIALVRHHYYNPIVLPADIEHDLSEDRILPGVDLNEEKQLKLLSKLRYGSELEKFPQQKADGYYYNNTSYVSGDAEVLYSMVRHLKPTRVLEIGSGFSTLLVRAALTENAKVGARSEHTCIEPYEMPWLESTGVQIVRKRVETLELSMFDLLVANDILFIDSSHVIRP